MIMKPIIQFNYLFEKPFSFKERTKLKNFIISIFKKEKVSIDTINYIFCSDAFLLEINKKFLKHNALTDIITFQLSEKHYPKVSDIYISIERVTYNAKSLGIPFATEFHRVIFHGVLHLCGYRDKSKEEKERMSGRESFYLFRYLRYVPRDTVSG